MRKSDIINALRSKYKSPEDAMRALGLDSALPSPPAPPRPLSRVAARFQSALTAHFAPRLAADAKLPDFTSFLADVNLGNYKASLPRVAKMAMDAVDPMLAPEAKAGGAGATPDDVIIRLLDMVGGQAAAEPGAAQADEAPPMPGASAAPPVTDPNSAAPPVDPNAPPAGGNEKLMGFLKDCGLDEAQLSSVTKLLGGGGEEDVDDEDDEDDTTNPDDKANDEGAPAMKPKMVTTSAMDAAILVAKQATKREVIAEQAALQAARDAVAPWVGRVSLALDSVDAIYRHALSARGVDASAVKDTAALPLILAQVPKVARDGGQPRPATMAADSATSSSMAERFPHAANIRMG